MALARQLCWELTRQKADLPGRQLATWGGQVVLAKYSTTWEYLAINSWIEIGVMILLWALVVLRRPCSDSQTASASGATGLDVLWLRWSRVFSFPTKPEDAVKVFESLGLVLRLLQVTEGSSHLYIHFIQWRWMRMALWPSLSNNPRMEMARPRWAHAKSQAFRYRASMVQKKCTRSATVSYWQCKQAMHTVLAGKSR